MFGWFICHCNDFIITFIRFLQKTNKLQNVELLKKFGKWNYEKDSWSNPRKRMPYLGRPEKNKALLTTATHDDYTEWGTIVAGKSDNKIPAKWMYPTMESPGVIWYWINENDCNADYKKSKISAIDGLSNINTNLISRQNICYRDLNI